MAALTLHPGTLVVLAATILLNVVAYCHARAMLRFSGSCQFDGARHEPLAVADRARWEACVDRFLESLHATSGAP